jgi:hypothetical protein
MAGGMGWGGVISSVIDSNGQRAQSGTITTKKNISQEGINKLIYDVLSSDQGLAALGGVENASGGYKSSTKSLLSQDLITKIVGELANVTAETTQTTDMQDVKRSAIGQKILPGASKAGTEGTVICTELVRQGKLDIDLYAAGHSHFINLPASTIRGYQIWAEPIANKMVDSPVLSGFFQPFARKRYEYIVYGTFSIFGFLSIYLGQPLCYVIGMFVPVPKIATITQSME